MRDADEATLESLQLAFLEEIPMRLRAIRAAYELIDWRRWHANSTNMLQALLHKLAGSAGTLGQASLSAAAASLNQDLARLNEQLRIDEDAWNHIGRQLTRLEQLTLTKLPKARSLKEPPTILPSSTHPLVYIVDDDNTVTETFKVALKNQNYRVETFSDLHAFVEACHHRELPHAILMDMEFTAGKLAGANVISELKADPRFGPIVIYVSIHDDLPSRLAAFRSGASRYFVKPVTPERILSTLDELIGVSADDPYRVLLVDDDKLASKAYAIALMEAGFTVKVINDALDTLDAVRDFNPDILLLDVYMPDATGPELAAVLREDERLAWMPIIFLSAEADPSKHAVALALGGDDFIIKPVRGSYLVAAVRARAWRARRNRRLVDAAIAIDGAVSP